MIIVRKYHLRPPLDWGDDCQEHLWLQNRLWNALVEIERESQAAWRAVFCADAEFAAMQADMDAITAALEAAWTERKAVRANLRRKQSDADDAFDAKIKDLAKQRSDLWERMKTRRNKLKPGLKDELAAVEQARKSSVKLARQNSGLWWGNYNAVCASFDMARAKALKDGATLQFHRFTGEGRFTNQIQHETGTKPVTLATLQGGKFQQVQIGPIDARGRAELKVTVYTGKDAAGRKFRRTLSFPMLMHRELPPGAMIKEAVVTCRKRTATQTYIPDGEQPHGRHRPRRSNPRIADDYEWSAIFTCHGEAADIAHAGQAACGINLGWRQTSHGLLIATLADSAGHTERLYLPPVVGERLDRAERLQSVLDEAANVMRARVALWVEEAGEDAPKPWLELAASAVRSRSHEPLARLAIEWKAWDWRTDWRGEHAPLDGRAAEAIVGQAQTLEAWRQADKMLRDTMTGIRNRAINGRRKFYEEWAGRIAQRYAVIGLGQMDLKRAAQLVVADVEENDLPDIARRNRQRASLYTLGDWLKQQAAKHGSQVLVAERPVTTTCHVTGQRIAPQDDSVLYACPACGQTHDRDDNAARVALADAVGAPRAVSDAPKPPKRSRYQRRGIDGESAAATAGQAG